jgi:hypothetical protein
MPATPYLGVNRHSRMYAPRPAHASFFHGIRKVFATQKLAASIIRMRQGSMGCAIWQKLSGEKAAHQHRLGDAADCKHISGCSRMRAVLTHGHVHVVEGATHDEIEFLVHFGILPMSAL